MNTELIEALELLLASLDPSKLKKMAEKDSYTVEMFLRARKHAKSVLANAQARKTPPIFVSVRGGVVTLIADETGEPHPHPVIIDYDQYDDGACPVCGEDFEDNQPCENCGYDASEDNGLECAAKYYGRAHEQTTFDREMSIPADHDEQKNAIINTSESEEIDPESVTLLAAAYDWECPHCNEWNTTTDNPEKVTCGDCGHTFIVDSAVHIGK